VKVDPQDISDQLRSIYFLRTYQIKKLKLNWKPEYDLPALVEEMDDSDINSWFKKGIESLS